MTNWKTLAIVFIILFVVTLTIFIVLLSMGMQTIEYEDKCSYEVCYDADAYYYDYVNNKCYCYNDSIRSKPVTIN
jgi:hypothetical protein